MKHIKLIVLALLLLLSGGLQAQVSVSVQIGVAPDWGPDGYSGVRYYYLPDIQAYYDVQTEMFIYYYYGGHCWVHHRYLPRQYRNYDLYRGYKVVMSDYHGDRPYTHYREHRRMYARGYHGQGEQRTVGHRPENYHGGNGRHDDGPAKPRQAPSGHGNATKPANTRQQNNNRGAQKPAARQQSAGHGANKSQGQQRSAAQKAKPQGGGNRGGQQHAGNTNRGTQQPQRQQQQQRGGGGGNKGAQQPQRQQQQTQHAGGGGNRGAQQPQRQQQAQQQRGGGGGGNRGAQQPQRQQQQAQHGGGGGGNKGGQQAPNRGGGNNKDNGGKR